ncbi:MAG: restriction endonuclease subunit R [Bacteroidetes bacterium HGW-Bacteroidetes-20]|nr:MAG: restriction endonuclease subunit R [Bacteroidetes bacterium HGW-Bacteroidetes-20]
MPKTRSNNGTYEIFDPIRKKWITLTEEEKVRQFCIQQLIENHKFPVSHIAVERQITVNGMTKRYDIVVFNSNGNPFIVIECKAPHVQINQLVLEQVGRYNKTLKAEIIGVSNGTENRFFKIDFETEVITEISFLF